MADSFFASKECADECNKNNMKFIGPVKNLKTGYPMKLLGEFEMEHIGDCRGFYSVGADNKIDKFTFVWVDRNRQNFISTTSSLRLDKPIERKRIRQVDTTPKADPEKVELQIDVPQAANHFFGANSKIDESNKCRQQEFQIETKIQTKSFDVCVNLSVTAINDVDTYYLGKLMKWWEEDTPSEYY